MPRPENVLFVGGPMDAMRQRVDNWPVEVVRDLPRYNDLRSSAVAPYERASYDRLVAAGADKRLYVLGVFRGWPSDA